MKSGSAIKIGRVARSQTTILSHCRLWGPAWPMRVCVTAGHTAGSVLRSGWAAEGGCDLRAVRVVTVAAGSWCGLDVGRTPPLLLEKRGGVGFVVVRSL